MIVRPLAQDFDWDQYVDVTDLAVPLQITDDLRPANSGRWDLTVRAGTLILADGGSQDADAGLDGAFAATPFMLDGF